jgi:hypothetical protein
MTSKSEVHNNVYKSELNQLEAEYEEIYSRCKQEKSKRKKEELTRKCNELKALHDNLRKDSRLKEYKRKSDSLAERLSSGAFWVKEGKNAKNIYFTNEQTCIYFVLIRLASMHNSWVSVWCNEGIDKFDSAMRVELYEYIKENIYMAAGIETWGKAPYIDQWLQVLDVEIDYTMSKRVCIIKELLEKMRMEGLAINHQINYGSIVCQDGDSMYYAKYPYGPVASSVPKDVNPFEYDKFGNEEQFLAGIENLSRQYLESIKQKSSDMLKWGIDFGKNVKELNDCVENGEENQSEDIEDFNYDFPEYEQRNKNLIRYAKSGIETVKKTLEELNISEEEAISYLEYL